MKITLLTITVFAALNVVVGTVLATPRSSAVQANETCYVLMRESESLKLLCFQATEKQARYKGQIREDAIFNNAAPKVYANYDLQLTSRSRCLDCNQDEYTDVNTNLVIKFRGLITPVPNNGGIMESGTVTIGAEKFPYTDAKKKIKFDVSK